MRTSQSQFQLLVEYMERNGDLSKPSEGPQGRATNLRRWAEITNILNADATGDTKTVEKWRKVWSDFKNNIKKKAARIHRATHGTGGGPACNIQLTALEERVHMLVGTQAATGIVDIPEVGLEAEIIFEEIPLEEVPTDTDSQSILNTLPVDWNRAGRPLSAVHIPASPLPVAEYHHHQSMAPEIESHVDRRGAGLTGGAVASAATTPPLPMTSSQASGRHREPQGPTPLPSTPRRRRRGGRLGLTSPIHRRTRTQTQSEQARQAFVRSDCEWRAFQQETERERLRLRQQELRTQERWQELFQQFLVVANKIADNLVNK